jgi:hypothetical protein
MERPSHATSERGPQQSLVRPELLVQLTPTAFGCVYPKQAQLAPLSQRVGSDQPNCVVERMGQLARGDQRSHETLEEPRLKLSQPLALHHDPVVVPAGEQGMDEQLSALMGIDGTRVLDDRPSKALEEIDVE